MVNKRLFILLILFLSVLPSISAFGQLVDPDSVLSFTEIESLGFVPYEGATQNLNLSLWNLTAGTGFFEGNLMPITTLSHDIGSGPLRWGDLYVSDISADDISAFNIDVTGEITGPFGNFTELIAGGVNISDVNNTFWRNDGTSIATGNWNLGEYNLTTPQVTTSCVSGGEIDFGQCAPNARLHLGIGGDFTGIGPWDTDDSISANSLVIRNSRAIPQLITTIGRGGLIIYDNSASDNVMINLTLGGNGMFVDNITAGGWVKGKFNWTSGDDWNIFDGSTLSFNDSKFDPVYHNPTQAWAVVGTIDGGALADIQHPDAKYDGRTFNFSEEVGSPGLELYLNFTGLTVDTFSRGIMRYKTSNIIGDYPLVQMWSYTESAWEDYPSVIESKTFAIMTQPVFDGASHIQDGVAQMRIYKEGSGKTQNKYYIDWIAIVSGVGLPASEELDPRFNEWLNNASLESNLNGDGYNITGSRYIEADIINASEILYANSMTFEGGQITADNGTFDFLNVTYNATIGDTIDVYNGINLWGDNKKIGLGGIGVADSYLTYTATDLALYSRLGGYEFRGGTDVNLIFDFVGTSNTGRYRWMEDENYFRFDNDIMAKQQIYFSDTGMFINSDTDSVLRIVADGQVKVVSVLNLTDKIILESGEEIINDVAGTTELKGSGGQTLGIVLDETDIQLIPSTGGIDVIGQLNASKIIVDNIGLDGATITMSGAVANNLAFPDDASFRLGASGTYDPQILIFGKDHVTVPGRLDFRFGDGDMIFSHSNGVDTVTEYLKIQQDGAIYLSNDARIDDSLRIMKGGGVGVAAKLLFKVYGAAGDNRYKGGIFYERTGDDGTGKFIWALDSALDSGSVVVADEKMSLTNTGNLNLTGSNFTINGLTLESDGTNWYFYNQTGRIARLNETGGFSIVGTLLENWDGT